MNRTTYDTILVLRKMKVSLIEFFCFKVGSHAAQHGPSATIPQGLD